MRSAKIHSLREDIALTAYTCKHHALTIEVAYVDIVYVSVSPWTKAAAILDTATKAFISAFTVTYTGINVNTSINN